MKDYTTDAVQAILARMTIMRGNLEIVSEKLVKQAIELSTHEDTKKLLQAQQVTDLATCILCTNLAECAIYVR